MKRTPLVNSFAVKDTALARTPMRVCIHILRDACNDVRVMRAGTTLLKEGFDVSVIDVQHERSRPFLTEDVQGMHMNHLFIPGWYTLRHFRLWFLITALRTFILSIICLLRSQADIYHAAEVTALPACFIAARLRRKPLVFEAYELPLANEAKISYWRGLVGPTRWLLRMILPRCAAVITTSPLYAREISTHYGVSQISLVRNVPMYQKVPKNDRLRQRLGLSPKSRIALYQGNLQADRCLDILVRAAAFVEQDTVIVLMGKNVGTTQDTLEQLIANECLSERVKILPPVPYKELLLWTASADIGLIVLPLDYSLSIRYTLPNKLFEYLMAGLPVLSSPLDAVVNVIKTYDVGQIAPSLSPAVIGEAINSMLANRDALVRMRYHALEAAKQEFNWEKETQQLVSLYHTLLHRQDFWHPIDHSSYEKKATA